ncbi:MAG: CRTAC1 family protein [Thermoanaerobaculia bacterium]
MRGRLRRRAALLLFALVLVACASFRLGYPGMTSGMLKQMRYGTMTENRNLGRCISYWLEHMQQLSYNPGSGMWTFDAVREAELDDLQRGQLAFHRGRFDQAVPFFDRAVKRQGESEERLFWLGMALMRQAEAENCLAGLRAPDGPTGLTGHAAHEHGLFCTLPLTRYHQRQGLSRRAAQVWTRLLDRYAPDDDLYRWLLNFSLMTVDEFPAGVPERYRIATPFIDAFYGERAKTMRAKYPWLHFTDRARELGIENFGAGRGLAVEDFDRDGDLDIVTTGKDFTVHHYRNDGGRFTDVTAASGLAGLMQPFTISQADYDNDGWIDLLVALPFSHFVLLHNRGNTFEDVTATSGLLAGLPEGGLAASWVMTWADVDNDGDLDLFVSNWAFRMPMLKGIMAKPRMDSALFVNDGGGRFHDANADLGLYGLLHDKYFIGSTFGDYDGDGFADLFLCSPMRGTSVLLHNEGGRRFVPSDAFTRTEPGFTAAFVDVDHDGRLDLFQAGFGDARTSVTQAVFGKHLKDFATDHSTILLQGTDGRFAAHDEFFSSDMPMGTMGAGFGDLDNDGCYDFYLGTGNPEPWFILPNLMYMGVMKDGRCTGRMDNVSMLEGFGNVQKGHGVVFFDFNDDGRQDVFSALGGMWPADNWVSQLFVNESGARNEWIKIRLRGRRTNYYGVGARIEVKARSASGRPIVRFATISQGTGFGSAPLLAHVGLADAVAVDGVEVFWPASGCRHTYAAQPHRENLLDEAECRVTERKRAIR